MVFHVSYVFAWDVEVVRRDENSFPPEKLKVRYYRNDQYIPAIC